MFARAYQSKGVARVAPVLDVIVPPVRQNLKRKQTEHGKHPRSKGVSPLQPKGISLRPKGVSGKARRRDGNKGRRDKTETRRDGMRLRDETRVEGIEGWEQS